MNTLPFIPMMPGLFGGFGAEGMAGGVEGASPLAGLFGVLMGQGGDMEGKALDAEALALALKDAGLAVEGHAGADGLLPLVQQLALGNGVSLELQGRSADVLVLQQYIVEVTVTLKEAGIDLNRLGGSAAEYAEALVVLGMPPEEAAAKASALEAMMAVLEKKLGLDEGADAGAQASLALLLLVGAVKPPVLQESITVAIRYEEQAVQMMNVQALRGLLAKSDAPADVVQALLRGAEMPVAEGGDLGGLGEVEGGKTEVGARSDTPMVEEVPVTAAGEDGGKQVAKAGQAAPVATATAPVSAPAPVGEPVVDAMAGSAASVAAKAAVQEVARDKVLATDGGEVLFRVREGKEGVLTVEATPASSKVLEQQLQQAATQQGAQVTLHHGGKGEGGSAPVSHAWPFAEHMAAAAKARAGEQAVVQMKGLAEQGGGTVRMQLSPASLGEIRIDLTIRNGEVSGRIIATEVAVVHELVRDMQHLRQGLADAGLKFAEQGVDVALAGQHGGGFDEGQQGRHAENRGHGSRRGGGEEGVAVAESDAVAGGDAGWVSPDQLVDVRV